MILRTIPRQAAVIAIGLLISSTGRQAWGQVPLPITQLPDQKDSPSPSDGPKAGSAKPGKKRDSSSDKSPGSFPPYSIVLEPVFPGSDVAFKLNLGQCIHLALEKQPRLQALRASLCSALAAQKGLADIRTVSSLMVPDLAARRAQAAKGVCAAQAELQQGEHDAIYSVVWTYYAAVYAKEQFKALNDLIEKLDGDREFIANALSDTKREIKPDQIDDLTLKTIEVGIAQAKEKRVTASTGYKRAIAGLREAIGNCPDLLFDVADTLLPTVETKLTEAQVVDYAVCRRGEMAMAALAADAGRLEIDAQDQVKFRMRTNTYAAGSDIHSKQVPQGSREGDYRPEAIPPEMPTLFVGNRENRVDRARCLSERADAVCTKTKNLLVLEARNGFLRWQEASERVVLLKDASEKASKVASDRERVRTALPEEMLKVSNMERLAYSQGELIRLVTSYNEVHYQQVVALAAIERITAGGIIVNYPGR